ncbi:MAG TPA: hypothetical protein PLN21_06680 [Gemmatales bacterium]|nr:hypothetical protein [Gemmatales bacterium]
MSTTWPSRLVERGALTLLVIWCCHVDVPLIAQDHALRKDNLREVKPFIHLQPLLDPNVAGPEPWWVRSAVIVALIVLFLLLVLIVLLLWKKTHEWRLSRETLRLANDPDKRLVAKKFLAVVSPRCDITPDERKAVAAALRAWLSYPYAKQVHGLEQLEAGEHPRIPAPHFIEIFKLLSPEELKRFDHAGCYWDVVLLEVKEGTDLDAARQAIDADLSSIINHIGFTADPSAYDAYTM